MRRAELVPPDQDELAIALRGDLAAILRFAAGKKNPGLLSEVGVLSNWPFQELVVAGAGFEPAAFRL